MGDSSTYSATVVGSHEPACHPGDGIHERSDSCRAKRRTIRDHPLRVIVGAEAPFLKELSEFFDRISTTIDFQ